MSKKERRKIKNTSAACLSHVSADSSLLTYGFIRMVGRALSILSAIKFFRDGSGCPGLS
jgi:hypothetical protein